LTVFFQTPLEASIMALALALLLWPLWTSLRERQAKPAAA
jgi:TctA family transporter